MNPVRNGVLITALGLLVLGLFLSECSNQPRLGLDHKDCVDPASPSLNGAPTSVTFFVQPDQFLIRHSEEVNW